MPSSFFVQGNFKHMSNHVCACLKRLVMSYRPESDIQLVRFELFRGYIIYLYLYRYLSARLRVGILPEVLIVSNLPLCDSCWSIYSSGKVQDGRFRNRLPIYSIEKITKISWFVAEIIPIQKEISILCLEEDYALIWVCWSIIMLFIASQTLHMSPREFCRNLFNDQWALSTLQMKYTTTYKQPQHFHLSQHLKKLTQTKNNIHTC